MKKKQNFDLWAGVLRGEGEGGRKGGRIFIYLMSVSMAVETMA